MKKTLILFFTITIFFFSFTTLTKAQILNGDIQDKVEKQTKSFRGGAGINTVVSVGSIAETVIKGFLSVLAIIFIILVIVAGYDWMSAAGDESKVTKGKDTLKRAVIGLIIIAAAYAITAFIFQNISMGANSGYQNADGTTDAM